MAALLMNLRYVPDEEADEVRALLNEKSIPYYETPPSMWGISAGAIWLNDEQDRERAKRLLQDYQRRRFDHQRAIWQQARERGEVPTLWRRLKTSPMRMLALIVATLFVLLFALMPFLTFG